MSVPRRFVCPTTAASVPPEVQEAIIAAVERLQLPEPTPEQLAARERTRQRLARIRGQQ